MIGHYTGGQPRGWPPAFIGGLAMVTPDEELIAHTAVLWQRGCGGGSAWIRWGLSAISDFRSAADPLASLVAAEADRLWSAGDLKRETRLLCSPSPAGRELLCCAVHYVARQPIRPLSTSLLDALSEGTIAGLAGHATMWARDVVHYAEALYELPGEVVGMVGSVAAGRSLRVPQELDLQRPGDLVDAVHAILSLRDERPPSGLDAPPLDLGQSRRVLQVAIALSSLKGTCSGPDVGRALIQSQTLHPHARDEFVPELIRAGFDHVPQPDSPNRDRVRDTLIATVDARLGVDPLSERPTHREAEVAAYSIAGLGDPVAVQKIVGWLADYPRDASRLFDEHLFDSLEYEVDRRGLRRDLVLPFTVRMTEGPPPPTPSRREPVEVFRPIGGKCGQCGGRMLALFDVRLDPVAHRGLTLPTQRVLLPVCARCCEGTEEGYASYLRLDDRAGSDVDAWPAAEADAGEYPVPVRQYVATTTQAAPRACGEAWFGGAPKWEQAPSWPRCENCRRRMIFAGQVTTGHSYYGFLCPDCHTSCVRTQYD